MTTKVKLAIAAVLVLIGVVLAVNGTHPTFSEPGEFEGPAN